MNTTRTEGLRQSDRIAFRIALEASWTDSTGVVQRQVIETLLVSRNGGVIRLSEKFFPGQEISLKRPLEGDRVKTARARIVVNSCTPYHGSHERLFQAIQGTGGTARLVILPHEDHGYLARESVLDLLAEQLSWLQRWLG